MKQIAGRYKVIEKLGTGLSGTVFSVKDGPKGPTVALKLSNPTEDSAHHLEKEFFTLSQLDHPNIVKVFDFGRTKNRRAYFTMELVKGKPFTKHRFEALGTVHDILTFCLSHQLPNPSTDLIFDVLVRSSFFPSTSSGSWTIFEFRYSGPISVSGISYFEFVGAGPPCPANLGLCPAAFCGAQFRRTPLLKDSPA